jgi:hypothetical protein
VMSGQKPRRYQQVHITLWLVCPPSWHLGHCVCAWENHSGQQSSSEMLQLLFLLWCFWLVPLAHT